MGWLTDETGLDRNDANYVPLTPLSTLRRAAQVFGNETAMIYGDHRKTYIEYRDRCTRLASALATAGVAPGDVVGTVLPNVPAAAEAHFGVPACGAVLNAINVRLDPTTIAYILEHGGAKALLVDSQFLPLVEDSIARMDGNDPFIIEVPDPSAGHPASGRYPVYEKVLGEARDDFAWMMPRDEWESLALNYTSGTTGKPKGVVYHHRGAYLNAMGQVISWGMTLRPRYLTIVPMFHCNAWCHIWMMPMVAGTVICCREIAAKPIFGLIASEGVTHMAGAPIVLNMLVNSPEQDRRSFGQTVEVFTAGAPPAPATLAKIEPMGFNVTQVYGLTEVYGPATECTWGPHLDHLKGTERAAFKARQGVAMPFMEHITVVGTNLKQIPMDGHADGEIVMRGNGVMKGYYRNPEATAEVFRGGYFLTGDIAVQHKDGYIQITDRAKDLIISGGENISSIEVEGVLMAHPDVLLAAVVSMPDEKWGEVPCAFVELKAGATATDADLIAFARRTLAGFKAPKRVVFRELPKTSTGKIQKFTLREAAKDLGQIPRN